MTLKLKVTSWSTWRLIFLFVCVLRRWFVLFCQVFGSMNSCQLRDLYVTLKTKGHIMVYVTFCSVRLLSHVDHEVTLRSKVTRDMDLRGHLDPGGIRWYILQNRITEVIPNNFKALIENTSPIDLHDSNHFFNTIFVSSHMYPENPEETK